MRAAILLLLLATNAEAQIRPRPAGPNAHVQSVDFIAGQVVQLQSAPGYQLMVELAPDEHVENVALGDSGAWQVNLNHAGNRLFLKPLQAGATTNMTVVSDARLYLFDLTTISAPEADTPYTVQFRYPAPVLLARLPGSAGAAQPEVPPVGRYKLRGDKGLRPAGIHDDGVQTYIEFAPGVPRPAIYAIDGRGRETLINGMMRDGRMVVDSVAPTLVFRIDRRKATAARVVSEQP
ncbi:type VI secretion protein [Sphingomonas sp. ABOLE]|uniref:TrbG/VirB9 family P-type conjugative transfer protein n=1 Tax=Sphingomonas sp. ABOLE TaxID=1985878 RepID=UPI000F7F1165|nr:TrbG/VirB9 family P-type conjugative transfer protein [Sphingomonas sp. ABOLE]RSV43821.1 type VI secretion protein [Sphingomonas sp. ABOLE]